MEISTYIDGRRPKQNGDMPVKIAIRRNSDTLFISTGLYTKTRFSGFNFPQSEMAAKTKTATLVRFYSEISELCFRNASASLKNLKTLIEKEITGKEQSKKKKQGESLADYCDLYSKDMKKSTARLYKLTADRIREYDESATPDSIDANWLRGFEKYLRDEKQLSVNGIAQKMRNIKSTLNRCHSDKVTDNYPFGKNGYIIREEETEVNNLTAQEFADLRDYPCEPWQRIYIDIFCLSTYLAGVNIGDLLLCKGLTKGRFVFIRQKTNKSNATKIRQISLPVYPEAMEIINRYKGKNHLLNIMDNMNDYKTFTQHYNKALKKIGPSKKVPDKRGKFRKIEYMPLFPGITTNSARYTFASVAVNDLDISDRTVAICMGHSWAKNVTSRYIANDQSKIDRTIRLVIDELNAHKGAYK